MTDEDDRKRKLYLLIVVALLISFLAFSLAQNAQNTADINNVFEMVVNNTNLAPSFVGEPPGTGERVTGTTYFANSSPVQLMVFAHASAAGGTATVEVWINNTMIQNQSGRPLAAPEQTFRSVAVIIPKGASYSVNFSNYHHYEWREYPILSGRNGTLFINQTVNGSNYNASYVPYIDATTDVQLGTHNLYANNVTVDTVSTGIIQPQFSSDSAIAINNFHPCGFFCANGYSLTIDNTGIQLIKYVGGLGIIKMTADSVIGFFDNVDMNTKRILNSPDLNELRQNDTYFDSNYSAQTFPNSSIISNNNTLSSTKLNKTITQYDNLTGNLQVFGNVNGTNATFFNGSINGNGNLLVGLTPVFSGWAVNPGTNPNLVNENSLGTLTTAGVTTAGTTNYIQYNLNYTTRIATSSFASASSGSMTNSYISFSLDCSNYFIVWLSPYPSTYESSAVVGQAKCIRYLWDIPVGGATLDHIQLRAYNI